MKSDRRVWFLHIASPQQGDLMLLGPPPGRGADGGARTRDRRLPADLRMDSQATATYAPKEEHELKGDREKRTFEMPRSRNWERKLDEARGRQKNINLIKH
ncbi:hypothetical protein PoB_005895400 [Plakobranchus ocellatus]|uniref:Uncharacterized protein n=1 Tax=Plakobranchus ocellatus TaxID=259542 RepID=A0AAV4CI62_9GAST|nr:hypothetical protein PoB_005895400 [Plakobranchus ocellatus]